MIFKNIIATVSALAITASYAVNMTVFAEEDTSSESSETYTSGDYTYAFNTEDDDYHYDDGFVENSIRIVAYSGTDTDVVVPDEIDGYTVTAFAEDAFADCTAQTLTLPSELNFISDSVFFGMTNCTEFKTGSNENFKSRDGVLTGADGTVLYAYPVAKTGTSYVVPNDVTFIETSAFSYAQLDEISLPSGLTTIDEWAFAYSSISNLDMPDTLEDIEQFAFAYCENLSSIDFSSSLTYIGAAAFACCSSLTSVDLPTSLEEVGQTAFLGTGMTEVYIPSSVTSIGFCAFGYDENFEAIDDFTIYGAASSQAEEYAKETDDENDYENDFNFVADAEETTQEVEESGVSLNTKMILTIILGSVIGIAAVVLAAVLVISRISAKGKKD